MGLPKNIITTWEGMRREFHKKYRDHYKVQKLKEEIFQMVQREYKSLEDYLERFVDNLQCVRQHKLDLDTKKFISLNDLTKESMNILNLMGESNISTYSFNIIVDICRRYFSGQGRTMNRTCNLPKN